MDADLGVRGARGVSPRPARYVSLLVILAILLGGRAPQPAKAAGPISYVKPGGTGDCSSWAKACDLRTAVLTGGEIWVSRGVYVPTDTGKRDKSFQLGSGTQIYGGFAGTETDRSQRNPRLNATILSGDIGTSGQRSDNSYNVVLVTYGASATLDGLIITGGNADGSLHPYDRGGGLHSSGIATVNDVTIIGNRARYGGGMKSEFFSSTLTNVTFTDNRASVDGGGLYNARAGSAVLTNVTFEANEASEQGGAVFNSSDNAPTLRNVTISDNTAKYGGAVANTHSAPAIYNSIMWNDDDGEFYNTSPVAILIMDSIVEGGCPDEFLVNCVNVIDDDPALGGLADNGGNTWTMAPRLGASAAVDAGGVNASCAATDQRGVTRPQGPACDIGAVEVVGYTISGNAGVAGAVLSYNNGGTLSVTADGSGNYSLTVPEGWSGTVTPAKSGYVFAPTSRTYSNLQESKTGQNYVATTFNTISGIVTGLSAADVVNVELSYNDGTAKIAHPSAGGAYSISVPYNWSGLITPSLAGYTFNPVNRNYANVTTSLTLQNYAATLVSPTISGTVSGLGAADMIAVALEYYEFGWQTVHPDADGDYTIMIQPGWTGTVTPSKLGYSFSPGSRFYNPVLTSIANHDYAASAAPFTISGNAGEAGVTLTYENGGVQTATADDLGEYSFGVPLNWSGEVTPSLEGCEFEPPSKTYTNVAADQPNQDYSATCPLTLTSFLAEAFSFFAPEGSGPETEITSSPSDPSESPSAVFDFTSPDSPVTFECQMDGGGFETCEPGSDFGPLSDGSHVFEVRAVDGDGNPDPSPASYEWLVNAPPQVLGGGVTAPAQPDDVLGEGAVLTEGVTRLSITFNSAVYDPPGDSDPDDVTNPANYLLVRADGDDFQTTSCSAGIQPGDTAITIDSVIYDSTTFTATLTVNSGLPLSNGIYRLYACGTTSIVDAADPSLKLAGDGVHPGTDFIRSLIVAVSENQGGGGGGRAARATPTSASLLPASGFEPGKVTPISAPESQNMAAAGGMWLEVPALNVNAPIVGIPLSNGGWNVATGLGANAVGYLEGSAYPTWVGNSVLTGHVVDAAGAPAVFSNLADLVIGDKVQIHLGGRVFVYEVRENQEVLPTAVDSVFRHETYNWVTLLTCEDWNAENNAYASRRIVRAVLISVYSEE